MIFENLNIIGGIASNAQNNVVYQITENTEYTWGIVKVGNNEYMLYDENEKVLSSRDPFTDKVSNTDYDSIGNIRVDDKLPSNSNAAEYQQWVFERVTVNPHIIKSDTVTKKNIATDTEWLFKFSDSEMDRITIEDVVPSNEDCISREVIGNYIIVRMNGKKVNGQNNSDYDEYSILTVKLDGEANRYVVVQDAGTGNGDACITKPFFSLEDGPYLHNVTLDDGHEKNIILTFKSGISISGETEWTVKDYSLDPLDDTATPAAEIYKLEEELECKYNNYAILTVKKIGVVIVTAINNGCEYKIAIVINDQTENGVEYYEHLMDWSECGVREMKLEYNTAYVFYNSMSWRYSTTWALQNFDSNASMMLHNEKPSYIER